jgi:hypothetical protein
MSSKVHIQTKDRGSLTLDLNKVHQFAEKFSPNGSERSDRSNASRKKGKKGMRPSELADDLFVPIPKSEDSPRSVGSRRSGASNRSGNPNRQASDYAVPARDRNSPRIRKTRG